MDRDLIGLWDRAAADFDQAADHGLTDSTIRAGWRELLKTALPPAPARVADLGCGTGTLSLLLAEMGYRVDGVDFSSRMLEQAVKKAAGRTGVAFHLGDASAPPLPTGRYAAVVSRHVLWALPQPAQALKRWTALLSPRGRLVLIEGRWHTGAGLTADQARALLAEAGREATLAKLDDPTLWGHEIHDERYLLISTG